MPMRQRAPARIVADWNAGPFLDHTDPYLVWLDLTGFAGAALAQGRMLPVIEEADAERRFQTRARSLDELRVLADPSRRGVRRFEVAAGTVSDDSARLSSHTPVDVAEHSHRLRRGGGRPVIGFIDYGCAFAHRQLRSGSDGLGTRVKALWDQGGRQRLQRGELQWACPGGFWYGAETHRDIAWVPGSGALDLAAYLRRFVHGGVLDEEACYRHSGYEPLIDRRATHGTHAMDLATGWPSPLRHVAGPGLAGPSAPHAADIVFVQLPRYVAGKPVSGLLRANVYDALRYIIDCTPDGQAAVINLAYGGNAGPHDGSSVLEQALDWRVQRAWTKRRVTVHLVIAAGNARDAHMHARAEVGPYGTAEFEWLNLPDDPSDSFVEFWFSGAAADLELRVTRPGGVAGEWVGAGRAVSWGGEGVWAALIHPRQVCQSPGGRMALLAVARTRPWPQRATAPYGRWRIEVRNASAAPVTVHAWCERDIPAFGSEGLPRQGRFDDTRSSRVERDSTLNSIAHGLQATVVGGHVGGGGVAHYSGTGPGRGVAPGTRARRPGTPARRGPDVLAPSDESHAVPGLLAAATIGTDRVRLDGTSMAAALMTRRIIEAGFVVPPLPKARRGALPPAADLHPDTDLLR
jgi:hypothetical protein